MNIGKPYHSERRTLWYVYNGDGTLHTTIELGQVYRSAEGATYRLCEVTWHTGLVTVERLDGPVWIRGRWIWRIESLLNPHMSLV